MAIALQTRGIGAEELGWAGRPRREHRRRPERALAVPGGRRLSRRVLAAPESHVLPVPEEDSPESSAADLALLGGKIGDERSAECDCLAIASLSGHGCTLEVGAALRGLGRRDLGL